MPPVHVFNRALISDPVHEGEGSLGLLPWHYGCRSAIEAALRQCEWNRADSEQRKQDQRTPKKMRLNGRISLFIHRVVPFESVFMSLLAPLLSIAGECGEKRKFFRKAVSVPGAAAPAGTGGLNCI